MKRIAITQRYDRVPGRNEWRDSLDAKWIKLLELAGFIPMIVPNRLDNVPRYLDKLEIDGLLLSGGNDIGSASFRDNTEARALSYADKHNLPVMGVCRGMQFLYYFLGGYLKECQGHVATYHTLEGDWVRLNGIQRVNSFHNKCIYKNDLEKGLEDRLECLAFTSDGVVEAFRHRSKPWLGVMWHPERETPFIKSDIRLIQTHFLQQDI